ncbi:uncharacterized protein LOC135332894 isoform X2 [Halichondria panicea]|uniref:uncharacterized protein LOC135332894 isoform X2 n=1 Tax=Halichondria panicea TaxID=6063 RepID=UPI00312B40E7
MACSAPSTSCEAETSPNSAPSTSCEAETTPNSSTAPDSSGPSISTSSQYTRPRQSPAQVSRRDDIDIEMETTNEQRKRSRVADDTGVDIMDHSGLYHSKRFKTLYKDGVLLCLPLSIDHLTEKTPDRVAREMARCLHETKHVLVRDVVRVMGVQWSLDIFEKTVVIQETGGRMTATGDKKRAPGGVFLTLVKEQCSDEERKDIFFKEKLITDNRKKMKKRLKKKNLDTICSDVPESSPTISEWNCSLPELPRISKNLQKRLGRPAPLKSKPSLEPLDPGQLQEEEKAAEDFEQTLDLEYQLDFS